MIRTTRILSGNTGFWEVARGVNPSQAFLFRKYLSPYLTSSRSHLASKRFSSSLGTDSYFFKMMGENTQGIHTELFASITDPRKRFQIAKKTAEINPEQMLKQIEEFKLEPLEALEILQQIAPCEFLRTWILSCKQALVVSVHSHFIQKQQVRWLIECLREAADDPVILNRISDPDFCLLLTEIFSINNSSDQKKIAKVFFQLSDEKLKLLKELISGKSSYQMIPALYFIHEDTPKEIAHVWLSLVGPERTLLDHPFRKLVHTLIYSVYEVFRFVLNDENVPAFNVDEEELVSVLKPNLYKEIGALKAKIPPSQMEEFLGLYVDEVTKFHRPEKINPRFIIEWLKVIEILHGDPLKFAIFQTSLIKKLFLAYLSLPDTPFSCLEIRSNHQRRILYFEQVLEWIQIAPIGIHHKFDLIQFAIKNFAYLSPLSEFAKRCEKLILESTNVAIQQSQFAWFVRMISNFEANHGKVHWLNPRLSPLLDEICSIRREAIRSAITDDFFLFFRSCESVDTWMKLIVGRSPHQLCPAFYLCHHHVDRKLAEELLSDLQPKFYKNGLIMMPLIELFCNLSPLVFSIKEREDIISLVLKAPKKRKGQKEEEYKKQLDGFRKQQKLVINSVLYFLHAQFYDELKNCANSLDALLDSQKKSLDQIFNSTFTKEEADLLIDKFQISARYPGGLFTYASRLGMHIEKGRFISSKLLGKIVRSFVKGTFLKDRYSIERSRHLNSLFSQNESLLELWRQPISSIRCQRVAGGVEGKSFTSSEDYLSTDFWNGSSRQTNDARDLILQDSDDIEDLLLSGTEVANSCQNILGNPVLNKCLLAVIFDGKIKIMVLKDSFGRIVARANLRVLRNKETGAPVLFVDKVYTMSKDASLEQLIYIGCKAKAKQMGIPLTSTWLPNQDTPVVYRGTLESLSGEANEYVDALAGVIPDGVYTLGDVILAET